METVLTYLASVLLLQLAVPDGAAGQPAPVKTSPQIDITGKWELHKHIRFGRSAVSLTADGCQYWLDLSKHPKALQDLDPRQLVRVSGTLVFREPKGDDGKDGLLPIENQDVRVGNRVAVIVVSRIVAAI